ncbi:mechanosensitive ion channel family protein [Cryomorphaceae bacterium 1068]|nr:mechanosensitive ion channel family protein [Cryomorphaceae bacterium 1068]
MEMNLSDVTSTVFDKLKDWAETGIALIPNLALAIVVLIAGWMAARFISKYGKKYITKFSGNKTIGNFLGKLLFIGIFVLAGVLALSVMNLDKTISSILAGLGIVGLALGFAFQDTAANLMSGIYISLKQPFGLGDIIETTNGYMGKVKDINLRVTKVQLFNGPIVFVPNKHLFQDYFINYTEPGKRRLKLDCGVSYGSDLEQVEKIAIEAVEGIPSRLQSEDVTLHWKEFGGSSINFSVNVWMEYDKEHSKYIGVRNEALKALKKAFDDNDITIPFPIRTLDFGIEGGQHLREELHALHPNGKSN